MKTPRRLFGGDGGVAQGVFVTFDVISVKFTGLISNFIFATPLRSAFQIEVLYFKANQKKKYYK